jgi:hypothetical protein
LKYVLAPTLLFIFRIIAGSLKRVSQTKPVFIHCAVRLPKREDFQPGCLVPSGFRIVAALSFDQRSGRHPGSISLSALSCPSSLRLPALPGHLADITAQAAIYTGINRLAE